MVATATGSTGMCLARKSPGINQNGGSDVAMINGMTVEEYNARERRRSSCVAKLHGYTPMEDGDTEESLKAEYLELTGETYRSREEEQADNVRLAEERRRKRIQAQELSEAVLLDQAHANGFMDCKEIRDALGYDHLKPNGSPYSPTGVAYRWIEDADEEVVYVLPEDGRRITSLTYRSGCWATAFPHILEVKQKWDADRAAREQKSWDDAQAAKDAFDKQKADALAALILKQTMERGVHAAEQAERYAQIDAARDAEIQLLIAEAEAEDNDDAEQVISSARRASIIAVLRSYTGPQTKNGLPKRKPLNAHAGFKIEGWEKRECWPDAQSG